MYTQEMQITCGADWRIKSDTFPESYDVVSLCASAYEKG